MDYFDAPGAQCSRAAALTHQDERGNHRAGDRRARTGHFVASRISWVWLAVIGVVEAVIAPLANEGTAGMPIRR